MKSEEICFPRSDFNLYIFILFCLIAYFVYIFKFTFKEKLANIDLNSHLTNNELISKIKILQDKLFASQIDEQKCQANVQQLQQILSERGVGHLDRHDRFLDKMQNPLSGTSPINPYGSFYERGYNAYKKFQQIGFITNNNQQYPIMGRWHNPNNSEKWEYYTINEGRNHIKIPLTTKNFNELYDGDNVSVPELGGTFTFKKYKDTDGFRYYIN